MLILLVVVAGCGRNPTGCDPCFTDAIVYGTVAAPNGGDVSERIVRVDAYAGSCGMGQRGGGSVMTNAQGQYRTRLSSLFSPFTADCISVTVPGVNGASDIVRQYPVTLEFRFEPDPARLDSVRVDIEL